MASKSVAEDSVEFKVFRKNFAYLKDGLKTELNALVPLLYQSDLITQERKDNALGKADMNQRTVDLLNAIECQVKTNPTAFSNFLGVLKSVPALRHLANQLEDDRQHMMKPPLASYSAETPTEPCGPQLVAPHEADGETEKTQVCHRDNGAVVPLPPSSSTMQPSDSTCVPPYSTQPDNKPSESGVHFFFSPTPETSHESRSDIVGAPQPLPLAQDGRSLSMPSSANTRTGCFTQPEFRREFKSKLKDLEGFVDASYSQKEEEVEAKNTELAQTSNEVQRQSKELLQLVFRLEEAEQQHEGYEAEIHGYQEELRRVESQHEKEKECLESQLLKKTKEYEGMMVAVSQLAKRCEELDHCLKNEREEHKQEMQQHEQEMQQHEQEMQQHEQEMQHMEQEVDSLKLQNVSLCEEKSSLCEELKQKEAEVGQKETEIHSLRQQLQLIDSEFSEQQVKIQRKIKQKKCISRSRLNSAELLDVEARMKQSVSQLSVFVENEDPALKKLISDIQRLFQVYDRKMQRSISWPSSLCNLSSLTERDLPTRDL